MSEKIHPIGSLLLPNEYARARGRVTSGIVLAVKDDLWGYNYEVFLIPQGFKKWLQKDVIRDLFTVVEP